MSLAMEISTSAMKVIAVKKLGISSSEVQTVSTANHENEHFMKFELLNIWRNKNPRNSQEVVAFLFQ